MAWRVVCWRVAATLPDFWRRLEEGVRSASSHWDVKLRAAQRMGGPAAAHMYYAQRRQSKLKVE